MWWNLFFPPYIACHLCRSEVYYLHGGVFYPHRGGVYYLYVVEFIIRMVWRGEGEGGYIYYPYNAEVF